MNPELANFLLAARNIGLDERPDNWKLLTSEQRESWVREWHAALDKRRSKPAIAKLLDATGRLPAPIVRPALTLPAPPPPAAPPAPMEQVPLPSIRYALSDITFVVSSFLRFNCLRRFLSSVRFFYPQLPIIVADQSGDRAIGADYDFCRGFPGVTWIAMPFDAGISASRNAAVQAVQTPLVCLLDDDHIVMDESRIESLLDVLTHDSSISLVCGVLRMGGPTGNGGRSAAGWFADLNFDKHRMLWADAPTRPWLRTARGTYYRPVNRYINCFLTQRQVLIEHPWYEAHKIAGEHLDHVLELWHAGIQAAYTPGCIFGELHSNSPEYRKFRARSTGTLAEIRWGVARQGGVQRIELEPPICDRQSAAPAPAQPNIVLLTPGNTGSTVVASLLAACGWHLPDNDPTFNEPVHVRWANEAHITDGSAIDAAGLLAGLPQPWLLKDPRLCHTLDHWMAAFSEHKPTLILLERDIGPMTASWNRRKQPLWLLQRRLDLCARHWDYWPWAKVKMRFEDVQSWVRDFDLSR